MPEGIPLFLCQLFYFHILSGTAEDTTDYINMPLKSTPFVAFDLETSGTLINKDCILQIG